MASLNFIDDLDDEQEQNAFRVAEAAKKAGVPPELAVAIAFKESGLRTNAPRGSSGEIGMMQVMPATGKGMGFSEKDLFDSNKNIEAGVKYLKEALVATNGGKVAAAMYYNAGPSVLNALNSNKTPPASTIRYVNEINDYGTFGFKDSSSKSDESGLVTATPLGGSTAPKEVQQGILTQDKALAQTLGGLGGASISAKRMFERPKPPVAPQMPSSGLPQVAPNEPLPPGGMRATGTQPFGAPGTYPTASGPGSATFNYGRVYGLPEIEAGKALGTGKAEGEVWDLLDRRREGLNRVQQMGGGFAENPRYGGIMTPQQGAGAGPRASYIQAPPAPTGAPVGAPQAGGLRQLPPRQPISMMPKQPSGLQMVTQELKSLAQPMIAGAKAVGRYAVPPLALAGSGGEAVDVLSEMRKKEPDYIKAGLSGLSGAAGLAALYPPLTIPAGIVGGGAALINYLREKEKQRGDQPYPSIESTSP